MIQDFIYYLREYGFRFIWENRKAIFFNNELVLMFAESIDNYENNVHGMLEEFKDLADLEYID